ncbi:MAG TPA: succinate dehydrogenase iron-sulfur subunit [Candidatus Dormibacteraeota bacterium]|nr:succinate dehydrogenase iron-sulfur subunit [Candidatus Dormibacteraeota bacterium]
MDETKKVIVRVKRQLGSKEKPHWEEFALDWRPAMNAIICLRDIAERPVTRDGKPTTPVVYDSNCLEEVCGSCAMVINGKAAMACSALIDSLEQPLRLEPMTKFPVIRDLAVDRSVMFQNLKRVRAWIPIDGTYDLGEGPRMSPDMQAKAYPLTRCITCGNCLEVCPQVNEHNAFIGAAIISQVRLFNMHPTGAMHARERLEAVMGSGGVEDCGNAQNCVQICPKQIPLTESIAEVNRQAIKQAIFGWLMG